VGERLVSTRGLRRSARMEVCEHDCGRSHGFA
jgi:hypothetical protein